MSYRANHSQQPSIFDRSLCLTERERKCLEKSWAKVFSDEIFPAIDEERFRVLYSENASRPNTPVNVIIGALIIKELFDFSDDEMVENLMLDIHYQYALHTSSFEEQPLSDKTLSRSATKSGKSAALKERQAKCDSVVVAYADKANERLKRKYFRIAMRS